MIEGLEFDNLKAVVPLDRFWAIEEGYAAVLLQQLQSIDLSIHAEAYNAARGQDSGQETPYQMSGSTAILSLSGTMTKKPVSMGSGCSTVELRRQVRHAARNPDVKSILMHIDSPGGQVNGLADLAKDFKNTGKHTVAFFEDLGASAAYYVGSQADEVYANDTALVGSIGTFAVVEDYSKMAEQKGVKVNVLRSGKMKGATVPGVEVSDEALSEIQGHVDFFSNDFFNKVSSARGISAEDIVSMEGKCFHAKEAHAKGLIDGVHSLDDVLSAVNRAQVIGERRTDLTRQATPVAANPPVKGKGGKRGMENNALVAAFAAAGFSALSAAVATAGETPEAVVKAIGREFENASSQTDPRLKMLDDGGVKSADDLKKLQGDAAYGLAKESELREYGKKVAIAALGQEKGLARATSLDSMPREILGDTIDMLESIEAEKTGRDANGNANRQTRGANLDNNRSMDVRGNNGQDEDLVAATLQARGKTNGKAVAS